MMVKRFVSTAVATTFALGAAAPAMAAIAYVEGGKWNYGVNSESVWSYYDHDSKKHKSSAVGQIVYPSGCAAAGAPARASGPKARFNNQSYYGFC